MMTVQSERDLVSIGQLAQDIQRTPNAIERACDALGIAPAMKLNHSPHFDAEQAERILAHFRGEK